MELFVSGRRVICGDGFEADIVAQRAGIAVGHDVAFAELCGADAVCDEDCAVFLERGDGLGIEVVEVFVRDKDVVCIGKCAVIGRFVVERDDRIDFELKAVVLDADAAVLDAVQGDLFA